jgi:tetratricopeptide (TPR) repeat protein
VSDAVRLIGRADELAAAVRDLTARPATRLLVIGVPGVGKSAFLRALVDEPAIVSHYGARRLSISAAGAATAEAFATRLSLALQDAAPDVPQGGMFDQLGHQRTLLAIDDADVAEHADALGFDELMARLAKVPRLAIVAAARSRHSSFSIRWSRVITLTALDRDQARELLIRTAGGTPPRDDQIEQLLEHAGKLPLAVELFGRALGSGIDPAIILDKAPATPAPATARSATARVVTCVLEAPDGSANARVLALLAHLPDGLPPELFDGLGASTRERIEALAKAGLVTLQDRATLRASSAETVKAASALDPADSRIAEAFYLDLVIRTADQIGQRGGGDVARRLSIDARNIEWAIATALERDGSARAVEAAFAFGNFMRYAGHGSLTLLDRASQVARARGDEHAQADLIRRLGDVARNRFELDRATASYGVARTLYQRLGDVEGVAACITNQAGIAQARQKWDEAAGLYQEAAALYQSIRNEKGEAVCFERLGDIAFSKSRFDTAHPLLKTAQAMYVRLGDLRGQGNCLQTLGDIACEQQQWEESAALLQQALGFHKEIGNDLGIANATFSLGRLALRRQDPANARRRFEDALAVYRSLGHVQGEANCTAGLADCLAAAGDLDAARRRYDEAIALHRRAGDVSGEATAIKSLGDLARRRGSGTDAKRLFHESLPLFLQVQDPVAVGEIHHSLAEIETNPAERRRHLQAALDAYRHTDRADVIQSIQEELAGLGAAASS